jgi:hypothetical protein
MNQNFQSLPIPVFKVEKVFQIVAGGNRGGKSNGNRICTHCGMTNHVVDNCYKKLSLSLATTKWSRDPWFKNNIANNGIVEDESQYEANEDMSNELDSGSLVFIPEQHKALLGLLQGSSIVSSHKPSKF